MGLFSRTPTVKDLSPAEVARGLTEGKILLVDVREPNEIAVEAYPDAIQMPMSQFDPVRLARSRPASRSFSPAAPASARWPRRSRRRRPACRMTRISKAA